jgi:hypothetical protein
MMFVVVSNVAMPPRIVPNANGMSSFDGEIFIRRATPDNDGSNNDAAAMLFMNSDNTADAVITPKINLRSPAPNNLMMNKPTRSVMPDRRSPSARMNAESIMMTACLLNPENASCGVRTPLKPNASININATMSARKMLPSSKMMAMPRNNKVRLICDI